MKGNPNFREVPVSPPQAEKREPQTFLVPVPVSVKMKSEPLAGTLGLQDFLSECGIGSIEYRREFQNGLSLEELVTPRTIAWLAQCATKYNKFKQLRDLLSDMVFAKYVREHHNYMLMAFLKACDDGVAIVGKVPTVTDDVTLETLLEPESYINLIACADRIGRTESEMYDMIRNPKESVYFSRFVKLVHHHRQLNAKGMSVSSVDSSGRTVYRATSGLRDMQLTNNELNSIVRYFEKKQVYKPL
jgi:hypothetical protein